MKTVIKITTILTLIVLFASCKRFNNIDYKDGDITKITLSATGSCYFTVYSKYSGFSLFQLDSCEKYKVGENIFQR